MGNGIWCVLPAAGEGRRAGSGTPKQYRPVLGRPLLLRTMERIAQHPRVAGLVVALSESDRRWGGWVVCMGQPVWTCTGGRERAESVRAGLARVAAFEPPDAWVLVHDAARPCLPHDDLDRLVREGTRHGVGALLATPVADTVKRADADRTVTGTVPRAGLWRALTPQLFRLGELSAALDAALADPGRAPLLTDEASALELQGRHPLLVEGSDDNIKVTTARDFARAEAILRAQGVRDG